MKSIHRVQACICFVKATMTSLFSLTEQIDEIRKIKLSSVICANGDHIERAQLFVMVLPDHEM